MCYQFSDPWFHSWRIPKIKIIINVTALKRSSSVLLAIAIGRGSRRAISTSNTKKITASKKNRNEKGIRAEDFGSKPHSKGESFSRSIYDRNEIILEIIRMRIARASLRIMVIMVIIMCMRGILIFGLKIQCFLLSFHTQRYWVSNPCLVASGLSVLSGAISSLEKSRIKIIEWKVNLGGKTFSFLKSFRTNKKQRKSKDRNWPDLRRSKLSSCRKLKAEQAYKVEFLLYNWFPKPTSRCQASLSIRTLKRN